MNHSDKLKAFKEAWITQSTEEEFYFAAFDQPKLLRRSANIQGALAALEFGRYQALDGSWVEDNRAIWIGMIVSDTAGDGGRLLDALTRFSYPNGLYMLGTPSPLKPRNWDTNRPFDYRLETLLCWYIKHGFKIVQSRSETRIIHIPLDSRLEASFTL